MRIFAHWRLVGQFLLWARREVRAGRLTYTRTSSDDGTVDHRWTRGRAYVCLIHHPSFESVELIARGSYAETTWRQLSFTGRNALETLRVLAALGLIDEDGELEAGGE